MTARFARPTFKILLLAQLALAVATTAGATTTGTVVAHGTLSNGGKTAHVKVSVTKPSKLTYKVDVSPAQKVSVYTSIVCAMGSNNGNGDQGYNATYPTTLSIRAKAPLTRQIQLPFPHPKYCAVEIYSNLTKSGKQTLDLLQD